MTETKIGNHITIARDGAIATVTIDRGDGRNALSRQLMRELTETARSFSSDLETQAVILTANGAFTAGADLKDPEMSRRRASGLMERRQMLKVGPEMCEAWERVEQITVAAIERYCIGGGVVLATCCDFRVMGAGAYLRLPEIPLGMNMSWQAIPRLVALIGPARTKRFVIFGEKLEAEDALAWGLIDEIAGDGRTLAHARHLAENIGRLPPNPVRMTKQAVNAAAGALNHATTFMDLDQYALATSSEDYREAVKAYLEKRPPRFTGR